MKIVKSLEILNFLFKKFIWLLLRIADCIDSHFVGFLSQNAFSAPMNVSRWRNLKNEKRRYVDTIFMQLNYPRVKTRFYERTQIANPGYNLVVQNECKSDDFFDSVMLHFSATSRRAENSRVGYPDFRTY